MQSLKLLAEKKLQAGDMAVYLHPFTTHEKDQMLYRELRNKNINWTKVGGLIEAGVLFKNCILFIGDGYSSSVDKLLTAPHELLYSWLQVVKFESKSMAREICHRLTYASSEYPLPYPLFIRNFVTVTGDFTWLMRCSDAQRMRVAQIIKWTWKQSKACLDGNIFIYMQFIRHLMSHSELFPMLQKFKRLVSNMLEMACQNNFADCVKYLLQNYKLKIYSLNYYYPRLPYYESDEFNLSMSFSWVEIISHLIDAGAEVGEGFICNIEPGRTYHWPLMKLLINKNKVLNDDREKWIKKSPQFERWV